MPTVPRCLPSCMFEGQLCIESPFEVASLLPEGCGDHERHRLFVRHVGEEACEVVCASLLNYLPCSL